MNHLEKQSQSGFLRLPNEVLTQIFDEYMILPPPDLWDNNTSAYAASRHRSALLQVLSIILTCRRFRDVATPYLYRSCFLEYQILQHRDIYRWNPNFSGIPVGRKYVIYQENATMVKTFCFKESRFAKAITADNTFQEIITTIPQFLSPLFASFNNLNEARFYSEVSLMSTAQVETYADGIHNLLTKCISLKKLFLYLSAGSVVCNKLKRTRREKLQQKLGSSTSPSSHPHTSPHANLTELHISCNDVWQSDEEQIHESGAVFSVLELFCDIIWPSAKTVTYFGFGYNALAAFKYSAGIRTNMNAAPLVKYDLPNLEKVSIKIVFERVLAAFDAFFNFDKSQIKHVEIRDIYVNEEWTYEEVEYGLYFTSMELEFICRHPNVEYATLRNIAHESDWENGEREGICSVLLRLLAQKMDKIKELKEITFYTPKEVESLIDALGSDSRFKNQSYTVTRCHEDSDYGAHIVFSVPDEVIIIPHV
ncbi:hypothetical protein TWF506_008214 [Arthrobotrys conoides]|uniref:F-box domain-containing protein n=1 Tax=Arthrobotrys conoides TaxID=74498 RepID=A0AAN8NCV5_9PEZI